MEEYERKLINLCESYILKASAKLDEDEELLNIINKIIPLFNSDLKHFDRNKRKQITGLKYDYVWQKKIISFIAYINFFQSDIFTSLKFLCLSQSSIEKRYFIKQSYASIHEFLIRIRASSNPNFSKDIEALSEDAFSTFNIMKAEIETFTQTTTYKLMEKIRNKISNHYDEDALLYINLIKELDELQAVEEITKVFFLIKYCRDFSDILMPILVDKIEYNNQILKNINA